MMKRKPKTRRAMPAPVATGTGPLAQNPGAPPEEGRDVADESAPDDAQRLGPAGAPSPARTDIERADERKVGSIEAVAQTAPESGVAGFVEPAGGEDDAPAMPPLLNEE
jgi:hypothetical protein